MAQVIIAHPDGRRYEVSDKAFTDLYAPFGFTVEGISYAGSLLPDTAENRAKADAGYGTNPNDTALTRENAARAVILSDLEAEARQRLAAEAPVNTGAEMIDPNATNATPAKSVSDGVPEASPTVASLKAGSGKADKAAPEGKA